MATKKISYKNLLKQAISEFDTSKTVQVKGPMLDPILSWDGDGELPVYKDAASILERYYFNDKDRDSVTINDLSESEYNEDGTEAKTDSEENVKGQGTEQAGTSDSSSIRGSEDEKAKDIAKEAEDMGDEDMEDSDEEAMEEAINSFFSEQDEDMDKEDKEEKELDVDKEITKEAKEPDGDENGGKATGDHKEPDGDEEESMTEDIENAVIEKLIQEMEDEEFEGVKDGMEAPKEKKASGSEEDSTGAGTEQAGTGTDAGQVPDRKDEADQMVKPKNYNEDKKLDEVASAVPGGPSPKKTGEDYDDEEDLAEAFELFKEAIEDEDEEEKEEEKEEKNEE